MANKETNELTAVSSLNMADIFALVQSGNSRKADFGNVRDLLDRQSSRTLVKPSGNQGRMSLNVTSVLLTPNGASVTATALIPSRSIVIAVTAYVIDTLTGSMTSFDVGVSGDEDRFGDTIGITAGSNNIGVVGPFATYADTDVIVTLNGGTGSGNSNKLRLVAYYIGFDTPAA
jgi:hypothetical protein